MSHNRIDTTGGSWGGGGMNTYGPCRLVNSRIHDNVLVAAGSIYGAGGRIGGGGVNVWENVTIERNHLVVNTSGDSVGYGGGLYTEKLTLRGCTINDNEVLLGSEEASATVTLSGGGVYSDKQLTLIDCNVTSNRITAEPKVEMRVIGEGGGIYVAVNYGADYPFDITRTTLRANTISVGGSCLPTSYALGGGERLDLVGISVYSCANWPDALLLCMFPPLFVPALQPSARLTRSFPPSLTRLSPKIM